MDRDDRNCKPLRQQHPHVRNGQALHPRHLEELRRGSGLSAETIARAKIATVTSADVVRQLVNWPSLGKLREMLPALAFPVFGADGEVIKRPDDKPYCITKFDHPRQGEGGKPIKYEAPRAVEPMAYFPPGSAKRIADATVPLVITEHAGAAARSGDPAVGRARGLHRLRL
jgi:hypothetical protein